MTAEIMFADLSLSEEVLNALTEMGFEKPSPIQAESIPQLLAGRDIIGQAQTGTGKTAAFGIPAIEMIDAKSKATQAIILCPTRELAVQVSEEIKKLSKFKRGLRTLAVYGGESIERQIRGLDAGAQIIVGTPGRVIDHLNRGTMKLDQVKMIILDEADEMLNMGFVEDIELILKKLPEERQSVFFSATMPRQILDLTRRFQKDPVIVKITRAEVSNPNIKQQYFEVRSDMKVEAMSRLIDLNNLKLMLAFCNTKKKVDELVEELLGRGYTAEGLHGDMRQSQRNIVMSKFKNGLVSILVATDVAARGIDVDNVEAVFNYDVPQDLEYYVHRIGRTGRAGKFGSSYTFVTRRDGGAIREIERYTKSIIERAELPAASQLAEGKLTRLAETITNEIEKGELDSYIAIVANLQEKGLSAEAIAAAAIRLNFGPLESKYKDVEFGDRKRPAGDRNDRSDSRGGRENRIGRSEDRGRDDRGSSRDSFRDRSDRPARSGDRDRDGGSERRERPARSAEGTTRLFINVGKSQNVRPGDIVGAIAGETGLKGSSIGQIDIFDRYTFVNVPNEKAQDVIKIMNNNTIKGLQISVEVAGAK
jgi:ATP-dependent RNA helicase DeaD